MKRSDFIKVIYGAMELIESGEHCYCCLAIKQSLSNLTGVHYTQVSETISKDFWEDTISTSLINVTIADEFEDDGEYPTAKEFKEIRLTALALYLAIALDDKRYKYL